MAPEALPPGRARIGWEVLSSYVEDIDARPSKRIYQAIIADYNLERSICELIDNALDMWIIRDRQNSLVINVTLNVLRQNIIVVDNSGGIERENMSFIVGPGQTFNVPGDPTIGFFGVGSKRAVVHLSTLTRISSRFDDGPTYRVEIDDDWIKDEYNWLLPLYEVGNINERSTQIELIRLRTPLEEEDINRLRSHLEATYAIFIQDPQINIFLNGDILSPILFQNWSFPPNSRPIHVIGNIGNDSGEVVTIEVWGGLSSESSPSLGNYGFFFYCNDRLIARGTKNPILGFQKGQIGQPHPKISLTKVIVSLKGAAFCMPWNSSKSDLNYNHPIFTSIRERLIDIGERYAKVSRGFVGDWPERFLQYTTGEFIEEIVDNFATADTSYLPPTPTIRSTVIQQIARDNRSIGEERPWTIGLYEGIIAVDFLYKKRTLRYRNRMCLILLDSTLEIAFKEYLVHGASPTIGQSRLRSISRIQIHEEMHNHLTLDDSVWERLQYYYNLRCNLIHERATAGIENRDIEDYREIVEQILEMLFGIRFTR